MLLITPLFVRKSAAPEILRYPLHAISSKYFAAAFIIGLIFIFLRPETYTVSLIVQVIAALVYAAFLIPNLIANAVTDDSLRRTEEERRYVKHTSAELKEIMESATDKQLQKKLEGLYDLLHSSPVQSNEAVRGYEQTVTDLIGKLRESIYNNDKSADEIIHEIEMTAKLRNTKLKEYQR